MHLPLSLLRLLIDSMIQAAFEAYQERELPTARQEVRQLIQLLPRS